MRLLLLNNNPAVSRLIKLSVDKVGYELDEFEEYGLVPLNHYDLIMVDNECYDEAELETLCEQSHCQYVLYICQRGSKKPEFANMALEKPFLPTDFLTLLEKIKNVLVSLKPEDPKEVEEEIDLSEDEPEEAIENIAAFDIDGIDTFGIDDDASFKEDTPLSDLSEKEDLLAEEDIGMDIPAFEDEDEALDLPTFDLDTHEEDELSIPLRENETNNQDSDDEIENTLENEETFNATSILDKDEINEVKQLLDESEEESFDVENTFELSGKEFAEEESLEEEDEALLLQETAFSSDEEKEDLELDSLLEKEPVEESDTLSFEETPLGFEDIEEDDLELETLESKDEQLSIPTQEEMIDEFEEIIEDKIEEELEVAEENEQLLQMASGADFDSLDDLNENAIKRAFGEDVEEVSVKKSEDVAVIRGEIENTIARSLSGLAQSDILREALKGMRINISITFDEKN